MLVSSWPFRNNPRLFFAVHRDRRPGRDSDEQQRAARRHRHGQPVRLGRRCVTPPRRSPRSVSPTRRGSSRRIARPIGSTPTRAARVTRGLQVIIAGAGGAAHLPGMMAALTPLPVLGVPVESKALSGLDSLLSIVQMPAGIPVGTLAIGRAGAINAALLAAAVLALADPVVAEALDCVSPGADGRRRRSARWRRLIPVMGAPDAGGAAPLPPGSVIGILGGGQLGRMTALAAARFGYRCHVFTPETDAPASQVSDVHHRCRLGRCGGAGGVRRRLRCRHLRVREHSGGSGGAGRSPHVAAPRCQRPRHLSGPDYREDLPRRDRRADRHLGSRFRTLASLAQASLSSACRPC